MPKEKLKSKRGITLIALVITIIVMLILVGVTVNVTLNGGIFTNAKKAAKQTEIEYEREALQENIATYLISQYDNKSENKLGEELYDKGLYDGERWDMVFTKEKNYGTGWNYIESGTEIGKYGKAKYNWVINYETGEIEYLENGEYHQLDYTDSMAVTTDIALNIDATNLSDEGSWENVENYGKEKDGTGGVTYDEESMALVFDGKDDYLKLTKPGDFSNGFTFEMYMNLDRGLYNNGSSKMHSALFCRIKTLEDTTCTEAMRFAGLNNSNYTFCKFYEPSSWHNSGKNMFTKDNGDTNLNGINPSDYIKKDVYLTVVYYRYKAGLPENDEIKQFMQDQKADCVACYINGKLYGYTGYGQDSYQAGLNTWNGNDVPCFVGVCPWWGAGNLYYLQGKVYTVRLYTKPLDSDKVWDNYDTTLSYRDALKEINKE